MVKDVYYTDPSHQGGPPPDDDLDQQAATSEFVSNLQPIQEQRRKSKRNKSILIILVALAALGAGGYFLFLKIKDKPAPPPAQQTNQTQNTEAQQEVPTEKYNSSDLQLSLDYPNNWTVDDSEQGLLKITSPSVKLKDSNGTEVDGKVAFTIISAGSDVTGFTGTSGVAVADSEKISYDQPTQSQREQTYVTQVKFSGNGLNVIYITGDSGYKKDQDVPKSDVAKIEPIISVTFEAADGSPLTIEASEWGSNPALKAAVKIITSLKIN
jgi:hypothetical protein